MSRIRSCVSRWPRSSVILIPAVLPVAAASAALPAIDGVVDRSYYGNPVAVQDVRTQFGDNNPAPPGPYQTWADGSELDAAYARISGGYLHLFFSGNLQSNFNKLELFFDNGTPGQNTIRRDNADVNFNALARMGENLDGTNTAGNDPNKPADDPSQPSTHIGKGLTFDTNFHSTQYMTVNCGYDGSVGDFRIFADFATTPADPTNPATPSTGFFVGGSDATNNRLIQGAQGVVVASDNSNNAGVLGGTNAPDLTPGNPEDPVAVNTGVELRIPVALLGNPTVPLKISSFINGSSHDFLSNQLLGPVIPNPDFGNLGEPRTVDFSTLDGDQFFTVALLPGDANGNGLIDADDFALTDAGRAKGLAGWTNGDFNNDGQVNQADYLLLDTSFLQQQQDGPSDPAAVADLLAARLNEFGPDYVAALTASVPEPTSLAACGLALLPLLNRRLRRQSR